MRVSLSHSVSLSHAVSLPYAVSLSHSCVLAALAMESSPSQSPDKSPQHNAVINHAEQATLQAQQALRAMQQQELEQALSAQREWQHKAEEAEARAAAIAAAMEAVPAEEQVFNALGSQVADHSRFAAEARAAAQV